MGLLGAQVALLVLLTTPEPGAEDRKEAAAHYGRAVKLYKVADYAAALAEFRAAWEAAPSYEVLFNIGLTERRLFKYGQALQTLRRYLKEGGARISPERREAVDDELAQIRLLTAPVALVVPGAPARVFIDGEPWGESPLPDVVPLGPGKHVLRAERDGHRPDEKTVDVVSGRAAAVQLEPRSLTAPVAVTVEASPSAVEVTLDGQPAGRTPLTVEVAPGTHDLVATRSGYAPSRSDVLVQPGEPRAVKLVLVPLPRSRPFPLLATAVLAGGLALGGGGLYFSAQAQEASKAVSTLAAEYGRWDASFAAKEAAGRRDSALAVSMFVGAGLAGAAGVVLLATHFGAAEPEPGLAALSLLPTADGVALSCAARF